MSNHPRAGLLCALCLVMLLSGCGQASIELPESAIHDQVMMLTHLDVAAANPEQFNEAIDALYATIPNDSNAQRTRLMVDGLRGEAKRHYRRFHSTATEVGIEAIVFGLTEPRERTVRYGSHSFTTNEPQPFVLIKTREGVTSAKLVAAATQLFGEPPSSPEAPENLFKPIGGNWFALLSGGMMHEPTGGKREQAQLWGQHLSEAGDAPLRMAMRFSPQTVKQIDEGLQELAIMLGDKALGTDGRAALEDLKRISYALHIGDSPRLTLRTWHAADAAAVKAEQFTLDLLDRGQNYTKIGIASMAVQNAPSPETVDGLFKHLKPRRSNDQLELNVTPQLLREVFAALVPTPIFNEMQEELGYELERMMR